MLCAIAYSHQHGHQPILICLGKVPEHKAGHCVLMARMTNSQPDSAVVCSQMGVDRAKTIMPRMTAALFDPQFAWREIQFIVKNGDLI